MLMMRKMMTMMMMLHRIRYLSLFIDSHTHTQIIFIIFVPKKISVHADDFWKMTTTNGTVICPIRVELKPETRIAGIALIVFTVLTQVGMIGHFYLRKNDSIFLRKRSINLVLISAFGLFLLLISNFFGAILSLPCAFTGLFAQMSIPFICVPIIVRVSQYQTSLSVKASIRHRKETKRVIQGSLPLLTSDKEIEEHLSLGNSVLFGCLDRSTYQHFVIGPYFVWVWLGLTCVPFVVFFAIKLALTLEWQVCSGCYLDVSEVVFFICMVSIILVCGIAVGYSLWGRPDPLRIIMELILVWISGASSAGLGLILHLIDPNGYQANGQFVWVWFNVFTIFFMTFFQTTFHVLYLKYYSNGTHLRLGNFSNKEILIEVLHKPELKDLLLEHMKSELSDEILYFLIEVDKFNADNKRTNNTVNKQAATRIHDVYIVRGAAMEVNISSRTRDAIGWKIKSGTIEPTMFDTAYVEVKEVLKNDILPRFLSSKRFKNSGGGNHAIVVLPNTRPVSISISSLQ